MKGSKTDRVVITPRDERLFKYLFVNKIAAVSDIQKDLFNATSTKTVHRRLIKLSRENFITGQAQRERGNRMLYFLTTKAFKEYIAEPNVLRRVQLKSDSTAHDLELLEIKRRFKAFDNVHSFYSENLIRSGMLDHLPKIKAMRELNSDAIVKINVNGKIHYLPLEYEASAKYSRRYVKLISKYYLCPQVAAVLFVSKNGSIEKRIRHKDHGRESKFYFVLLDEIKKDGPIKFTNNHKEVLWVN